MEAASSSTQVYKHDVFPSFRGEDVRRGFLSYLLKEFQRKAINTFIDNRIDRGNEIAPVLVTAIKDSRIAIVIFSKNYASSTWCLNELLEIYKCHKKFDQIVIPVFYEVDRLDVMNQTEEFKKSFMNTCERETYDKKQEWIQALSHVAKMPGEDFSNWSSEAHMVEKIVSLVAIMAFSSGRWRFDVFLSYSGEKDVRKKFLSHLCLALDRRSVNSFIDNGIVRSYPIRNQLISVIKKAKIAIVIFSKNYAASTWCLNELLEIHTSKEELTVIPVFYDVDPSEVRKQEGEFGEFFMKTCEGKTDDNVEQMWKQALTDVANIAGEHLSNGLNEADMIEKIADDVSNKLVTQSNGIGDCVGFEDHLEAMNSLLDLKSEEVRMIGIWGQSGIGKSTLGRALFNHLSSQFPSFRNFTSDEPMGKDVPGLKLKWEKEFLSKILKQENLKIENTGEVKKRLNSKKVLIVLDDVVNQEFLETLVGETNWFGPGSRIIVITQDKQILKSHKIDLSHEVKIPAPKIALTILCRSAFGKNSPREGFKELAEKVARLAGDLPLGLHVMGKSLKGRTKEEWMEEVLPELQNGLDEDIMKPLRISYNRLKENQQEIFLWIACLFNGESVKSINDFFEIGKGGLKRLEEKSLIRIAPKEKFWFRDTSENEEIVEMHDLLMKLGKEIVRAESKNNPWERLVLTDAKEIEDVLIDQSGTKTVRGIYYKPLAQEPDIELDEKSFERISSLQFLKIDDFFWHMNASKLRLPNGLVYLPRKLKYIEWDKCPMKCLPSNFKAEYLVELRMKESKLEKLWQGTPQLGSLKTIMMQSSRYLKEIPDLSKAINLERVDFSNCYRLESFPNPLNWKSLEYLNLCGCNTLENFPQIIMKTLPHGIEIGVDDCLWNENLSELDYLDCLRRCHPLKFLPEHIVHLEVKGTTLKKLWKGVQSLGSLQSMDLTGSKNLKEIPDLSKAINLEVLFLSYCNSLVTLPSTIGNLHKLEKMKMKKCTGLKVLPDLNLSSLKILNLRGCSSLTTFPQISHSIEYLYLDHTAIEVVPCCIEMFLSLTLLSMRSCDKLKNISANIFRLTNLKKVDFADCGDCVITTLSDSALVTIEDPDDTIERSHDAKGDGDEDDEEDEKNEYEDEDEYMDEDENVEYNSWYFNFWNCLKLNRDGRELIIQSSFKSTVIVPGGEVPAYFNHRADINFLPVTLPSSSLSHQFLRFNVCVLVESLSCLDAILYLQFRFDGIPYMHTIYVDDVEDLPDSWKTDHLVLFSFKFQPICLRSKLDSNDVKFEFKNFTGIKKVGIRVLNVSTSQDDGDGRSSETESNNQSGEKCDIVETERSKKRMRMTSSIASNLWIDSMITEQQDSQLPVMGWGSHLFPSFSNEDVPWEFLSHLLTACHSCTDNKIDVSRPAIKEARLSVVIFSKNYASSTWYLNELVEIHKCHKESALMVIPIFYYVDPCEVRNQAGEFGESFMKTCEDKSEAEIESWKQALTDLANLHGEHVYNGSDEGSSAEMIAKDVSSKLRSLWFDSIKSS